MTAVIIPETNGLSTHSNDLAAPVGSTSVADNVVFSRDGRPERRKGFKDYSTNLPDFAPKQLLSSAKGDQAYLHLDNGIWYKDSSSGNWLRKRGVLGSRSVAPFGLVVLSGHIYYTANNVVWDVDLATGVLSALAGRVNTSGGTDAVGSAARFGELRGITTNGVDLFVCDAGNDCVKRVELPTGSVTTIASFNGAGTGTADGTGISARFNNPSGITFANGNLYVAESANHTIRRIAPPLTVAAGVVTTVAGLAGSSGTTDATGSSARFNTPSGICYNGSDLLVSDTGNHTIRRVAVPLTAGAGVVTTSFGSAGTPEHVDGIGTSSRLESPYGIFFDGLTYYFCDYGNDAIRQIYPSSYLVTLLGIKSGWSAAPARFADGIFVGPD